MTEESVAPLIHATSGVAVEQLRGRGRCNLHGRLQLCRLPMSLNNIGARPMNRDEDSHQDIRDHNHNDTDTG